MRREAEFQTLFRHWLRSRKYFHTAAFELKQTRTESIPFSDVQAHQMAALQAAKTDGMLYKIPDDSRGIKPFDMVYLKKVHAFVVIRYPSFFCIIDIDVFIKEKMHSSRRSLTSDRARTIAQMSVNL